MCSQCEDHKTLRQWIRHQILTGCLILDRCSFRLWGFSYKQIESLSLRSLHSNGKKMDNKLKHFSSSWVAQLVGTSSCTPKRLWVWFLVREHTGCFSLALMLYLSLLSATLHPSKINKHILGWRLKQKLEHFNLGNFSRSIFLTYSKHVNQNFWRYKKLLATSQVVYSRK